MTELTYIQVGDYRIPNITLRHTDITIGRYGRMRREYLKEHRPILYNDLILTEKLFPHLQEIDQVAQHRMDVLIPQLKTQRGTTEELKATDQMRWVQEMNAIRQTVEEIILSELIYEGNPI